MWSIICKNLSSLFSIPSFTHLFSLVNLFENPLITFVCSATLVSVSTICLTAALFSLFPLQAVCLKKQIVQSLWSFDVLLTVSNDTFDSPSSWRFGVTVLIVSTPKTNKFHVTSYYVSFRRELHLADTRTHDRLLVTQYSNQFQITAAITQSGACLPVRNEPRNGKNHYNFFPPRTGHQSSAKTDEGLRYRNNFCTFGNAAFAVPLPHDNKQS